MSISKWKIKGIVDDFTECGCCGRRGLKRTVAMMPLDADGNEDGTAEDVVYYGTSCAAQALGWSHSRVTDAARAARAQRKESDSFARRMISIYAPLEFAPARDKIRVFYGRNQGLRGKGLKATEEVAQLLSRARATLADTMVSPARPSRIEDFRPFAVIFTRDERIHLVQPLPLGRAEREKASGPLLRCVEQIRGKLTIVAALDAESARDVAYADDLTREYNTQAWHALHG
ncbi:hypothetical protein [Streptomyces sp. cg36]|uniref:hypothetical protein n=1 Tax=Streptomyces sp. cg36 TaxID=3238798 RepID=UPI0034E22480